MPKRTDIKNILILGAGPIVIGQACEFDYSGVQACKALREEKYRIIVVNSNPATIMTDPDMADVTYIEPVQWEIVAKIIEKERPDAILPTMGGQTALNCILDLERENILKKFHVEIIGVTFRAIIQAENRLLFYNIMKEIGLDTACSFVAHNFEEAMMVVKNIGFPCIIRPSYTMGGAGGGIADDYEVFKEICNNGFCLSPINEIVIDESLIGWKEYEMEVIRDKKDNCIVVCSIENFDPMGIHTGDSITVSPAQTLTDKEYQFMRNASISVLREVGIEGGGANVQFSVNPKNGRLVIIEMNPRLSRSSALASKATGFPIAKIATKLAVGYTLDELMNDITGGYIPASFEPSFDYVVTKIPRFNFEKFANQNNRLTTQMKSIGEVMAIGRTQQESLQKALRGLEIGVTGFDPIIDLNIYNASHIIQYELKNAGSNRIWYIADAFRIGMSVDEVCYLTNIDPWFLAQIKELICLEEYVISKGISCLNIDYLRFLKRKGFSDARLSSLVSVTEGTIRALREEYNVYPVYKKVDTCAAEFGTNTSYMYSTYDSECESDYKQDDKEIMILGGGPNRIGQGIEFDYCCVHAALALRQDGYKIIMVNCNPETVSTDYDISDYLFFEPITLEDILEIVRLKKPIGVIIQYGGQTPLKLAKAMALMGIPIIGTDPASIDQAEDRRKFQKMIKFLNLKQPDNATVVSLDLAIKKASVIGYPLVVRPSYVLGGRAMEVVHNESELRYYFNNAVTASDDAPVLLDRFLNDAIEVDVDAICDGENVLIGGIMEHVEQAGIHSGDSACSLPPYTLSKEVQDVLRYQVKKIAFAFKIRGLMNVQFAIKGDDVYLLEVNPRASRTVPFVSKATGLELAKIAARVMVGISLSEQNFVNEVIPSYFSVKEAVLPFNKFSGIDPVLGPEMRSTGEVMGMGYTFAEAFSKAIFGTSFKIKKNGRVLLSFCKEDKDRIMVLVMKLLQHGFKLDVTKSTALLLNEIGISSFVVNYVHQNVESIQSKIKNGDYSYIIDTITTKNTQSVQDDTLIRLDALQYQVHYNTTLNGSFATTISLNADAKDHVISVQDIHARNFDKFK
ncbi:carbamoyl-phosphate synthase large subunit [Blochmannia endosymbiont of Camponotus (Colobopsis) obliquus]|uniref:carbamoyl-phosphate synthase large subunit n=1 Tax=Blochmannia endosymbiont of Camponotus (Colobopsis) obliquus TaxID=1505597 RepID=UPI00061A6C7E|nr:carbamoyl-phosphate synthase large subunit [Blochmannia endosymbiont of Camponotus (Colobopsis) obliquus]AKC60300.1 carbamoyl-phosphate synthase large chain [Blochmannia endosymbiont of Camponotus (Colobopsis) obliquus]